MGMTALDDDLRPIAAATTAAGWDFASPMGDDPGLGPQWTSPLRRNTALALDKLTQFPYRDCVVDPVHGWPDPCSPTYDPDNPDNTEKMSVFGGMQLSDEYYPFTIYSAGEIQANTTTIGWSIQDEAERFVEVNSMAMVAAELDRGKINGGPSLRSEGWDITPGATPVSFQQALSILLWKYSTISSDGFMLHVPWALIPTIKAHNLLDTRGGLLSTVGIPIHTSPGLSGVAPNRDFAGDPKPEDPDPDQPANGTFAVYATRSIPEYNLGPIEFYGGGPLLHHLTNTWAVAAERRGVVRFNPACIFAVQVSAVDEVFT